MKTNYLYILKLHNNGSLFIDITENIKISVDEHRNKFNLNINKKRNKIPKLVYYEKTGNEINAISSKKKLEKWDKVWKNILIESFNPGCKDLYKSNIFREDFPEYFFN